MSVGYRWVQWSHHKRVYDAIVAVAVLLFVLAFVVVSKVKHAAPESISNEIILLRALGSAAFVLLHVILVIGPLCRIDVRFLPLLSNRRHLGVLAFLIALAHATIAVGYYHGFGHLHPLVSLLVSNTNFDSLTAFPFQLLGLASLIILFLMAATSHDFWLKNLGSAAWKRLHQCVYPAYAMLVAHVALGTLQTDRGVLAPIATALGLACVVSLHVVAGLRERRKDLSIAAPVIATTNAMETWIDAGLAHTIPPDRARTVCASGGERIAIFRHGDHISAVTNVCAHQGGPIGEGKIIDGCITCPWHGWQYRPHDGCSPPPFKESVATYQVRIVEGRVHVGTTPSPPGSPTIATIDSAPPTPDGAPSEAGTRSVASGPFDAASQEATHE